LAKKHIEPKNANKEEQRSNEEIIWEFFRRYRHMFKWHKGSFILTQKMLGFFVKKKRIFLTFIPPRSGSLKPLMHFSDKSVRRKKLSFSFCSLLPKKFATERDLVTINKQEENYECFILSSFFLQIFQFTKNKICGK
jgi:hypothetical protein